jgi:hypothetical protein
MIQLQRRKPLFLTGLLSDHKIIVKLARLGM